MPVVLVIVGLALLVTAYNDTFGNLTGALKTDVPGFAKWGGSLIAVGALGYIPGMQTTSRWLLALVGLVLVLRSYQANNSIFSNFASAFTTASASTVATSQTDPATAVAQNPSNPSITTASIQGTTSSTTSTTTAANTGQAVASAVSTIESNPYNPQSYLSAFYAGMTG